MGDFDTAYVNLDWHRGYRFAEETLADEPRAVREAAYRNFNEQSARFPNTPLDHAASGACAFLLTIKDKP